MAQVQYIGTGRRKSSVARVRLVPGTGKIVINKREIEEYVPFAALREVIKQPLVATETTGSYDIHVNVNGGGYTGQAGAVRHGIARALLQVDPDFRAALKSAGLLTRDSRMKERKNQVYAALVVHPVLKTLISAFYTKTLSTFVEGVFCHSIIKAIFEVTSKIA